MPVYRQAQQRPRRTRPRDGCASRELRRRSTDQRFSVSGSRRSQLLDEDLAQARLRARERVAPTAAIWPVRLLGARAGSRARRRWSPSQCAATSPTSPSAAAPRAPRRASWPRCGRCSLASASTGTSPRTPRDLVSTPRRGEHLPRVLSAREAARLLDGDPRRRSAGAARPRDVRAGLLVRAARGGDRVAGLGDVDHDGEQLRVEGKGRKTRFVPVGEPAMAAVRRYLERARGAARGAPAARSRATDALFLSRRPAGRSARATCGAAAHVDGADGSRRGHLPARAAPQLRHASAGRRRGPAQHPGDARATRACPAPRFTLG